MNLKLRLAVALFSFAPCFTVCVKAMSFEDFAKMNNDDEAGFVAFLVESSAKMLKANGQPEQADKAISLFHDAGRKGGVSQVASYLKMMNTLNKRNATNPNNRVPPYQIEDALASTFKDAGIIVPTSFLVKAGKDFQASGLPRQSSSGH